METKCIITGKVTAREEPARKRVTGGIFLISASTAAVSILKAMMYVQGTSQNCDLAAPSRGTTLFYKVGTKTKTEDEKGGVIYISNLVSNKHSFFLSINGKAVAVFIMRSLFDLPVVGDGKCLVSSAKSVYPLPFLHLSPRRLSTVVVVTVSGVDQPIFYPHSLSSSSILALTFVLLGPCLALRLLSFTPRRLTIPPCADAGPVCPTALITVPDITTVITYVADSWLLIGSNGFIS